ncbi:acetyl-CoA synthetase-like protein [Thozetella sp. PMI_491]|nr:acetyl-CoA synthetase-like protein [Thozetella sp. PMI_491]
MASLPALALAAVAGTAYLQARWSVEHDWLFFRILMLSFRDMGRAERAGRLNIFYVLEDLARNPKIASRPCLFFDGRTHTFAETYDLTLRWGTWLKEQYGVSRGDIVAVDMQNSDTFVFAWFGIWSLGATPAFINYNLTGNALTHSLRTSTAKLVLVDPSVQDAVTEQVRGEFPNAKFVVVDAAIEARARATHPIRSPDEAREASDRAGMAILIYTSGTTGLPKPAVVSWAKIYVGSRLGFAGPRLTPEDVLYTCMPLYHSSAAILGFLGAFRSGSATAIGRKFSTKTFWSDVRRYEATIIQYVGETCRYLLVAPPEIDPATGESLDKKHKVRAACGNGLRVDVWGRFKDRFGIDAIWEVYSATEGAGGLWNLSKNDFSKGAIGRFGVLSNTLLSIRTVIARVDYETQEAWRDPKTGLCARVRKGEPGELLFRLLEDDIRANFQGYFNNKGATNSKVLRNVLRKGDAYFRTGDVVRWDTEGRVFFVDRLGDTFRWKSENVSTAEVAEALGDHPAVQEANVYGVQVPHHDGRAGCAAVVLSTTQPGPALLRSLAEHVNAVLPRYAAPLFLRVTREVGLQATGTNKQQKTVLRDQGVEPSRVEGDLLYWLRDGTYVPFTGPEWLALEQNQVRL